MNEIKQVNNLIKNLGLTCVIPPLQSGNYTLKSSSVSREVIKEKSNQGWYLYSDRYTRDNCDNQQDNLLEAQWYNPQEKQSGYTQLLGNNTYQLTTVQHEPNNETTGTTEYVIQKISTYTNDTNNQAKDNYHILWKSTTKGKYIAIAQAYLGNDKIQENN